MSTSSFLLPMVAILSLSACASSGAPKKLSDADRATSLLELASASINDGDPTGAIQNLNQVEALNEKIPEEHYLYCLAYYQKGESEMAITAARRAIALKPDYSAAKNTLGKLLLDEGKYAEAEKYLAESAADLSFRDAYLAKTNLGILYFKTLRPELAMRWLTSAIKDGGPAACMAAYYRGQIEMNQNSFDRAQADLKAATRNNCSGMAESHLALGQALIRMKKYDQARVKLMDIQKLFPDTDAAVKATQYLREIP
jgi:type IV pilus assembly protein PilF